MSRLAEIINENKLASTGTPGEFARPNGNGINMQAINMQAIPTGANKEALPDGEKLSDENTFTKLLKGVDNAIGAHKRGWMKRRAAEILRGDHRAISAFGELEGEAQKLQDKMRRDPGLRKEIEGAVRGLPIQEQAYVARLLTSDGSPSKKLLSQIEKARKADEAKKWVGEHEYHPIGRGLGDSALVTGQGFQVFVGGSDNTTYIPDAEFSFESIASGRLRFEVPSRGIDTAARLARRVFGKTPDLPGTIRVTDSQTGRIFEIRGVEHPDEYISGILSAAEGLVTGRTAAEDVVRTLLQYPDMLNDG